MAVSNSPILTGATLFTDTANSTTAVVVKASSAVLYEMELDNTANAAATYMRLYNAGSATFASTVPDSLVMVPASTKITLVLPSGVTFGTALAVASGTSATLATTTTTTSAFSIKFVYV